MCRCASVLTHCRLTPQITVEPCLQSETVFDETSKDTKLRTDLPPTSLIEVKWTEKQARECIDHVWLIGSEG
jgi:hypothetical protein